jgi:8-oxo-dGTP pyrophosphatase MutT (NUDIX family)
MARRFPGAFVSAYWRLTRGATLGAQGAIFDGEDRVLLIRQSYTAGWQFPGGGVEWRETAEKAMVREVFEETGVVVKGRPQFHGLFANFAWLPSDHVALFVVKEWERPSVPPPNREIVECRWFAREELPGNVVRAVPRRIEEILDGAPIAPYW